MASNAKTIRARLKELLPAYVPGLLAENIYDYRPPSFGGITPAALLTGTRRRRTRKTFQGSELTFYFTLSLFALYKDDSAAWTVENATDYIDDMEAGVAALLDAQQTTDAWHTLDYAEDSVEDNEEVEGGYYRYIDIPLMVKVMG